MASHGGKSLLWAGEDAFTLYILVVVLNVPPAQAGTLFLGSSIWNAGIDALWGAALARFPGIRGRLPYIAWSALLVACASFVALPLAASGSLAVAAILLILFRTAFALFDVPHNAVAAVLAGEHGHLRVMRLRTVGSSVAGLAVAAAAMPLLTVRGAVLPAILLGTIGVTALLLLLPLPWLLTLFPTAAPEPPRADGREGRSGAMTPILLFCLIQMVGIGALASVAKAALHLDSSHLWAVAAAPLLIAAMRLGAIPPWSALARRVRVTTALVLAYAASTAVVLALPAALALGSVSAAVAFALFGAALGGVALLAWSVFSQLLEEANATTALGRAALGYGIFTATMKIGLGGSALLAGHWLANLPVDTGLTGAALSPLVLVVALLILLCALVEWLRQITHARWRCRGTQNRPGFRSLCCR